MDKTQIMATIDKGIDEAIERKSRALIYFYWGQAVGCANAGIFSYPEFEHFTTRIIDQTINNAQLWASFN